MQSLQSIAWRKVTSVPRAVEKIPRSVREQFGIYVGGRVYVGSSSVYLDGDLSTFDKLLLVAAENGDENLFKLCMREPFTEIIDGIFVLEKVVKIAILKGHIGIIKCTKMPNQYLNLAVYIAVKNDLIDMVEVLEELGARVNKYDLRDAAENGSMKVCKLLVGYGIKDFSSAATVAAVNGHIEIVKFFFTLESESVRASTDGTYDDQYLKKMINTVMLVAIEENHIKIVELCIKYGCEDLEKSMAFALKLDHKDIVRLFEGLGVKVTKDYENLRSGYANLLILCITWDA
jgi:ankyrin repeat protein